MRCGRKVVRRGLRGALFTAPLSSDIMQASRPGAARGARMRGTEGCTVIENYILLFFTCAFGGWLMEVACKLVQLHRFINRGFLIGPYCPIYGFGAVLITALLTRSADSPAAVFALAMLVSAVLEYLTSYAMEKLFHARWWDYSHKPFNLNGRVCLGTLVPFGLMGLAMVYFVKPAFFLLYDGLPGQVRTGLCALLCLLLLADTVISTTVLGRIRSAANLTGGDDTESITRLVHERLAEQGALVRRTLRAFPYAQLYSSGLLARMKAQRQALREEARQRKQRLRREIDAREQRLRSELRALRARRR